MHSLPPQHICHVACKILQLPKFCLHCFDSLHQDLRLLLPAGLCVLLVHFGLLGNRSLHGLFVIWCKSTICLQFLLNSLQLLLDLFLQFWITLCQLVFQLEGRDAEGFLQFDRALDRQIEEGKEGG